MPETLEAPMVQPQTEVEEVVKFQLKDEVDVESQVIIHCNYTPKQWGEGIRIWPSTFLYDNNSPHKSELLYSENISKFPQWTFLRPFKTAHFTLVFSGLPKSCSSFNLIEEIPQKDGFEFLNILRNKTDIYHIDLSW
jgi:hypothetical protein